MHCVMKVVAPLRVNAIPSLRGRVQYANIIQIAFGDQMDLPAEPLRQIAGGALQLGEKMPRPEIEDPVNRIEPQSVEMIVLQPVQSVFDEKSPDLIAACTVKVERLSPGSAVTIGKVRPVSIKVVAFRAEMVVDHVQRNCQSARVSRIHKLVQRLRTAVSILRSEFIHAVVSPVA